MCGGLEAIFLHRAIGLGVLFYYIKNGRTLFLSLDYK